MLDKFYYLYIFSESVQESRSWLPSHCDDRNPMREPQRLESTRTRLTPRESEELVKALTPEQKAHLLEHHYVWVKLLRLNLKLQQCLLAHSRQVKSNMMLIVRGAMERVVMIP